MKLNDFEQKIWDFMFSEHKTPVMLKTLTKKFIASDSKTTAALNRLVDIGWIELHISGSKKFYKVKGR